MNPRFGIFCQIGIVVRDLEVAIAHYRRLLGIGPFLQIATSYEGRYRDWRGTIANRNAFARLGEVQLELVQPERGDGNAREWLESRGEGIFHLGFATDDVSRHPEDVCFESFDDAGRPVVAHLDTVGQLGYFVELIPQTLVAQLDARIDALDHDG